MPSRDYADEIATKIAASGAFRYDTRNGNAYREADLKMVANIIRAAPSVSNERLREMSTWEECQLAYSQGRQTSLTEFIRSYEPAGVENSEEFRGRLADVLSAPSDREAGIQEDAADVFPCPHCDQPMTLTMKEYQCRREGCRDHGPIQDRL